jgi:hypothetical protein
MKTLALLTVATALGWLWFGTGNAQAGVGNTNALLVQVQITAVIQSSTVVTNGNVETATYGGTTLALGNQDILNMLEVEFATSFPAGAQLAYNLTGPTGFHVLSASGESILDVSTNAADHSYAFGLSNNVTRTTAPMLALGKAVVNLTTTNATETVLQLEPDEGVFYTDSHGNHFHVDGLLAFKIGVTVVAGTATYNTVSFTLTGSGGGTFFNPNDDKYDTGVFTKAKISAVGKGIIE